MNEPQIKAKAQSIRESKGGTIFAFPTEEDNPFSTYAVTVYRKGVYFVYPSATDISTAAAAVLVIIEEFKKIGVAINYEKDVRLVSYQAQIDAPDVSMQRLKKGNGYVSRVGGPLLQKYKDYQDGDEDNLLLSARGTIKVTYLTMVDEQNPEATRFMDEYYKLLAMNRYGKTAAAIKREVRQMGKEQAIKWIEQTYETFIKDPMDIFNIMQTV